MELVEAHEDLNQRGHNSVGAKSTRATEEEHTRKILLKHNLPLNPKIEHKQVESARSSTIKRGKMSRA
jgi:hypothetical protein